MAMVFVYVVGSFPPLYGLDIWGGWSPFIGGFWGVLWASYTWWVLVVFIYVVGLAIWLWSLYTWSAVLMFLFVWAGLWSSYTWLVLLRGFGDFGTVFALFSLFFGYLGAIWLGLGQIRGRQRGRGAIFRQAKSSGRRFCGWVPPPGFQPTGTRGPQTLRWRGG